MVSQNEKITNAAVLSGCCDFAKLVKEISDFEAGDNADQLQATI